MTSVFDLVVAIVVVGEKLIYTLFNLKRPLDMNAQMNE